MYWGAISSSKITHLLRICHLRQYLSTYSQNVMLLSQVRYTWCYVNRIIWLPFEFKNGGLISDGHNGHRYVLLSHCRPTDRLTFCCVMPVSVRPITGCADTQFSNVLAWVNAFIPLMRLWKRSLKRIHRRDFF